MPFLFKVVPQGMLDKKRQEKIKATIELEKIITEILVANGRTKEPFIKVFHYSGENVVKSSLGSLVGVFEVTELSEDSAYIVNFLASVAKKEYFSNPRRGAIESLETALHKINLALAELVKHGNIAWLGKFHGVIGVLEKNNFHFTVTGEGTIFLLRNGIFSEISEGLASPESTVHPIKTFVEISSGRLLVTDKIILSSPELFELLLPEDLEKNASRMDRERFAQFLRTVLINEIDMGGSLIIDIKEGALLPPPVREVKKPTEEVSNVFSELAFQTLTKPQPIHDQPTIEEPPVSTPQEYTDSKTGHIYVQGDSTETSTTSPLLEHSKLFLQDALHAIGSTLASQGKFFRKTKKQGSLFFYAASRQSIVIARKTARVIRKQWHQSVSVSSSWITSLRQPQTPEKTEEIQSPIQKPIEQRETPQPKHMSTEQVLEAQPLPEKHPEKNDAEIPLFMREKLAAFYQKNTLPETPPSPIFSKQPTKRIQVYVEDSVSFTRNLTQKISTSLSPLLKNTLSRIQNSFYRVISMLKTNYSRYKKFVLAVGVLFASVLIIGFFLSRLLPKNAPAPVVETSEQPIATPTFPLDSEKNAHLLSDQLLVITTTQDVAITSVILESEPYLITPKYILNIQENKSYSLPAGSGNITFASTMDDLRLIFVYTDNNEIFSFSPISHAFVKNTLTLPNNVRVEDIGTYLTYLYVLDKTTNQIYRFPRAEGGFGTGSSWLKEGVTIEEGATMAINETIYASLNKTTVAAFFRGRFVKNLESSQTPLSVTSLFTHPGLSYIYALDTNSKRVLIWNQDGLLLAQYFSDQFADAKSISADEKTSEVFLTTLNSLISFKFNLGQ